MDAPSTQKNTLNTLPPEILLRIFQCCPNLPVARKLASTCQATYSTWLGFQTSICEEILPRTIRCYDDAKAVAAGQDKASSPVSSTYQNHVRRLLWNAMCAERACDIMGSHYKESVDLNENEQRRTIHVFYTIQAFVVLFGCPATSQPWSSSAAERFLHTISDCDSYIIAELVFAWNRVLSQLDLINQLSPFDMGEKSRELQRNPVEEAFRLFLIDSFEQPRLVHPTFTAWRNAIGVIYKYVRVKCLNGGNDTGNIPGSRLGIRVLLDHYQHRLVKRK